MVFVIDLVVLAVQEVVHGLLDRLLLRVFVGGSSDEQKVGVCEDWLSVSSMNSGG